MMREGLQDGTETCYVWFGDSDSDNKTRGRAEDAKIMIGSDHEGQD